jgi:anti-anti-sigma regulatory factor
MTDGIAHGQWVEYVGSGSAEQLRDELAGFDGLQQAFDNGDMGVCPIGEFYAFCGHSDVVDPAHAVDVRVIAAEKALAAGYTGFRAVVDCTAVARTPQHREAFARFEYLIDQKMSALPVTALCAYDASELGAAAVAEMACLHPLANEGFTSFHLYADQDIDFALAGEIDLSCAGMYATTLGRIIDLSAGPELIIDARGLTFIDHRRLLVLAEFARSAGNTVVLRTDVPSTAARVVEVLGVKDARVVVQQ